MPDMKFSGKKFKEVREARGMTRAHVATEMKRTEQTIFLWEWERVAPRPELVPYLAAVLRCSINDIMEDKSVEEVPA